LKMKPIIDRGLQPMVKTAAKISHTDRLAHLLVAFILEPPGIAAG
jgi:hypothetical protein